MAHAWDALLDASFKGVTFEFEEVTDDDSHALGTHEFPDRAGGRIEDTGRRPSRFNIVAVFYGLDYLERLAEFRDVLQEQGPGELVHPIWGPIQVVVESSSVQHRAGQDFATVPIVFVEDQLQDASFETLRIFSPDVSDARVEATALDVESTRQALLGTASSSASAATTFRSAISAARTSVESTEDDIESALRTVQGAVSTELAEVVSVGAEVAPLLDQLHTLSGRCVDLANVALSSRPRVIEVDLMAGESVFELANRLYGDPSRVDDLFRLNDFGVGSPLLLPRGLTVRVHAS